jgi:hypothetical protein
MTAQRSGVWLLAGLMLLAPALWNGFALLQYDTGGYLARWYEGYLVPSRPGAYGLLLLSGVPFAFWTVLAVQAAVTIWIVLLLLRDLGFGHRPRPALSLIAALCVITTLPFLASVLLTDIFAGLMVLALHLIAFGRTVTRGERIGLGAFVAFAAATHSATFALMIALAAAGIAVSLVRPRLLPRAKAVVLSATIAAGVVAMLAGNYAVSSRVAFTPGGYGILFGRMLQSGIVPRYLKEHCPDPRLRLCAHQHEMPHDADSFLWGQSVFNRLGRFVGLGEEMRTIVLESARAYPMMQVREAGRATMAQLVSVATGEGVINRIWHTYAIVERYTPALVPAMRGARQQRGEIGFAALNRVHVPVGLLAAALLPFLILLGGRVPELSATRLLAGTLLVALLVNAFVCGALANPHDRYGARLIWLAPLTIILAALSFYTSSTMMWLRRAAAAPELRAETIAK